jgi:hypothetical protein
VIWHTLKSFRTERAGWIIGSAFFLIMLWGYQGNVDLLGLIVLGWRSTRAFSFLEECRHDGTACLESVRHTRTGQCELENTARPI